MKFSGCQLTEKIQFTKWKKSSEFNVGVFVNDYSIDSKRVKGQMCVLVLQAK